MRKLGLSGVSCAAMGIALLVAPTAAFAQDATQADDPMASEPAVEDEGDVIVVTAQRRSESLQNVPIAVSAFSAESLEKQQIDNSSDLQLTLPNVTFTKTQFTSSSFTIRGIGDLCVGISCDSATAIHVNGSPVQATRLFETEFFDLERIEVLRGPQGTLFGRNATSGVVNVISAKPKLSGFAAAGEFEYGNFNSMKAKGMINLPVGDSIGVRLAGFWLDRGGYTKNQFDGKRVDDRNMYAVRGSLRFEPTDTTTIDLMGYYFREKDNRARVQKIMCDRDESNATGGVLGCLPGSRRYEVPNGNSTFVGVLTSRQFLAFQGIPTAFALGSLYGPDAYANSTNPADPRVINSDWTPTYFADEKQFQARLEQELGAMTLQLTGMYQTSSVDSTADYSLSIQNRAAYQPALNALAAAAAGQITGLPASYFTPIASAIIPNGPAGNICTSLPDPVNMMGAYGGQRVCTATPVDFDRSNQKTKGWSAEAILTSDFDGMFNFLLGGIYTDGRATENSYYVHSFGIDYLAGILGTFNSLGRAAAGFRPSLLGSPFYRNHSDNFTITSKGVFGEAYVDFSDRLKLTMGIRYNNDVKTVRARQTLATFPVPFTSTSLFSSPYINGFNLIGVPSAYIAPFDGDPTTDCTSTATATGVVTATSGCELWQERKVKFTEWTGRAVVDFKLTDDNLIYASYSKGYKSGGVNPPVQAIFAVPDQFTPETIGAFEIGSKNVFGNGELMLNATAFYYKYNNLQLSRIVARTSVNDNVDADIYGFEVEGVVRPDPAWTVNLGFSYLKSKVTEDKFLANPRDPSGGRADAVIIRDISNGSNCAVVPTVAGNATGANGFVTAINNLINQIGASRNGGTNPAPLAGPSAFPANSGVSATGAYSLCAILTAGATGNIATINPAFAPAQALLNSFGAMTVYNGGLPVNIKGNELPQAPNYKFSIGVQYEAEFDNGMVLTPRFDLAYTGESFGNIFGGRVNRVNGFAQANAQVQLDGLDKRWFVRAFVQNIFDSSSTTGLYVGDQTAGVYTNVFTLEPRRYGIAAGFKF